MPSERPERRFSQSRPSSAELAKWDAILKADADKDGETILTHEEEARGLAGEDVEMDDLSALDPDEVRDDKEAKIAQAIASEPGNRLFCLPGNQVELVTVINQLRSQIRRKTGGEPKIYVHSSCVTGEPCVCVCSPANSSQAGEVLHLPTVRMYDFNFDALSADLKEIGISIKSKSN